MVRRRAVIVVVLLSVAALGIGSGPAATDTCRAERAPKGSGTFGLGGYANLVAFGDGAVWTVTAGEKGRLTLWRIDPRAGAHRAVLELRGRGDVRFAVAGGTAWISDPGAGTLTTIDLRSGKRRIVRPFGPEGEPTAVAVVGTRVWVAANDVGELAVVDRRTKQIVGRVRLGGSGTADVEAGFGAVWASTGEGETVVRVDPSSRRVASSARVGGEAVELAVGAGAVWVDLGDRERVRRIAPRTGSAGRLFPNGGSAFETEAAFGSVWITNYGPDTVTRLNPQTARRTTIDVGRDPKGIAAGAGSIWVVNAGECSISRLRP